MSYKYEQRPDKINIAADIAKRNDRIRKLAKQGLKPEIIAERIGISKKYIVEIIAGRR